LVVFAVVLSIFIFDALFIEVSTALSKQFERIGFSTRIFNFIIEGDIIASKGREALAKNTIEAILENPLWGYGVTGDRALLGIYPHNIFLEVLCQYGIIFGSILIIATLAITVRALFKIRKDRKRFAFALMLVSLVFVKLMISSTYTTEPYLFFMMGYFVLILRDKR
jgi:O-antigen ligase